MLARFMEGLFYSTAIAIALLVVGLNCLQGTPIMPLFGYHGCNYSLSSQDLRVKAGAAITFILFLALLFGPILAVLQSHRPIRSSKRSK